MISDTDHTPRPTTPWPVDLMLCAFFSSLAITLYFVTVSITTDFGPFSLLVLAPYILGLFIISAFMMMGRISLSSLLLFCLLNRYLPLSGGIRSMASAGISILFFFAWNFLFFSPPHGYILSVGICSALSVISIKVFQRLERSQ